jgi:hypothetical protein
MLTLEDLAILQRPFPAEQHMFTRGYVYLQEQAIMQRLNEIDPAWSSSIVQIVHRDDQVTVHMSLTVKGVTRHNVGSSLVERGEFEKKVKGKVVPGVAPIIRETNEAEKGATTDALKRVARSFGIGLYILDIPTDIQKTERIEVLARYLAGDSKPAPTPKPQTPPKPQPKPAADVNPFELNEFQQALREKLAELGMTGKNGGFDYLFANILPGQRIYRMSDLHPVMNPDDVLSHLPDIARRWRASQQPDPSPDDSGSKPNSPTAPAPAQSSKPAAPFPSRGSGPIESVLNPPRASTRRHVLEGDLIQIETIKAIRETGGFGYRQNFWRGTAQVRNEYGTSVDIELNIWPEDARKLADAGHTIDWPTGANEYATFTPTQPVWVYFQNRKSGYSFSTVEPVPTAADADAQRTA